MALEPGTVPTEEGREGRQRYNAIYGSASSNSSSQRADLASPSSWPLADARQRKPRWSLEQSQAMPPGAAPTRNEWPVPPHVGNWSQGHRALSVCYKQRWKHKGMRVTLHLPF